MPCPFLTPLEAQTWVSYKMAAHPGVMDRSLSPAANSGGLGVTVIKK